MTPNTNLADSYRALPQSWATPSSDSFDARTLSGVEFQVVGTPGGALTPQRSLDGSTFVTANAFDLNGAALSSITAAGIYSMEGGGYLRLTGTLAPATITVRGDG